MAITRWNPFAELRSLTRHMDRALGLVNDQPIAAIAELTGYPVESWPATDIYEDKEELVFRTELPGLELKEVELLMEDSTLTLRGSRKLYKEDKKENYRRVESAYGAFTRSFALPSTVDKDKARAEMRHGILEVHLPKREAAKARTIPISG